jgi:hypothetical protein
MPDNSELLAAIDARLATASGRPRQLLETVREHVVAESVQPDVDQAMATLSDDPRFFTWGSSSADIGPKGAAAVRAEYEESLKHDWASQVQFNVETLVADGDVVALQGTLVRVFPGKLLSDYGYPVDSAVDHLWETEMAVFYTFTADCRIARVDTYPTGDTMSRLRPA